MNSSLVNIRDAVALVCGMISLIKVNKEESQNNGDEFNNNDDNNNENDDEQSIADYTIDVD